MDPIKTLHVSCAMLSGSGFILRCLWMWRESPWLKSRVTRFLPHVVDTVLLGSAILLAIRTAQYPLVHAWLSAKVVALLAYIVLGSIALKHGPTRAIRTVAAVAAVAVFAYIVAVARTRSPLLVLFF